MLADAAEFLFATVLLLLLRPSVTLHRVVFRLVSTKRSKWLRKSAPMIGVETSAKMNVQMNSRRRPNESLRRLSPNVLIDVPFAAKSLNESDLLNLSLYCAGRTETSAPVSI